jgi:hypothetical protein
MQLSTALSLADGERAQSVGQSSPSRHRECEAGGRRRAVGVVETRKEVGVPVAADIIAASLTRFNSGGCSSLSRLRLRRLCSNGGSS